MFTPDQQAAVRLGDSTSHGSKVISATSRYILHGVAIAKSGDMTHCPQCNGDLVILTTMGLNRVLGYVHGVFCAGLIHGLQCTHIDALSSLRFALQPSVG